MGIILQHCIHDVHSVLADGDLSNGCLTLAVGEGVRPVCVHVSVCIHMCVCVCVCADVWLWAVRIETSLAMRHDGGLLTSVWQVPRLSCPRRRSCQLGCLAPGGCGRMTDKIACTRCRNSSLLAWGQEGQREGINHSCTALRHTVHVQIRVARGNSS